MEGSSGKAILYAFLANLGIALAKGAAAFFTRSGSMLAEAIHSLADCTNQLLLFLGLRRSKLPACPEHPLGYGKVIYFWSFIVAILLFSMGGLFSIYEGIHKLSNPEELKYAWAAMAVLGVSIVLESLSLAGALREIKKIRGDKSLREWVRESRNAELMVVMGEDVGALVGLSLALIFIILTEVTGNPVYDSLGSMAIGGVLIAVSLWLVTRIHSLIIGRCASPELRGLLEQEMGHFPRVTRIYNVITVQFGPDVVVAAKLKLERGLDIDSACVIINRLEREIKKRFPEVRWTFIEPDVED